MKNTKDNKKILEILSKEIQLRVIEHKNTVEPRERPVQMKADERLEERFL